MGSFSTQSPSNHQDLEITRSFVRLLLPQRLQSFIGELWEKTPLKSEPIICEHRLSGLGKPIDISLGIYPKTRPGNSTIEEIQRKSYAELSQKSAVWEHLIQFLGAWQRVTNLARWIGYLFLEFDANAKPGEIPEPIPFVALDSPQNRGPDGNPLETRMPEIAAFLETGERLLGRPFDGAVVDKIKECFSHALPHGRIVSLGTLAARRQHTIRIIVLLYAQDVCPYLRNIGYCFHENQLEEVLPEIVSLINPNFSGYFTVGFDLELDANPQIGDRVGIEILNPDPDCVGRLLKFLVAQGLCCQEYYQALLDLPGTVLEVAHFKLSFQNGAVAEAKSYLNYYPSRESFKVQRLEYLQ